MGSGYWQRMPRQQAATRPVIPAVRGASPAPSVAAAVIGAVLASFVVEVDGMPLPTPAAFQLSFVLGGIAAVVALVMALFIPRRRSAQEKHPSLPE